MRDNEQALVEAAARYQELLDRGTVISIPDYVATVTPELREELALYLELIVAIGDLEPVATFTPAEQQMADRAAERMRTQWQERASTQPNPTRNLTQLRNERKLPLGALARALNLPVDLLARIERGGVEAATIPGKLVDRLASQLGRAADEIRAALQTPAATTGGVMLNAADDITLQREATVRFEDALLQSAATPAQRAEWTNTA